MKTGKESAFNSLTKMGRLRWRGGGKEGELFFSLQYPPEGPQVVPKGHPGMI
jgi:hypothetical protein